MLNKKARKFVDIITLLYSSLNRCLAFTTKPTLKSNNTFSTCTTNCLIVGRKLQHSIKRYSYLRFETNYIQDMTPSPETMLSRTDAIWMTNAAEFCRTLSVIHCRSFEGDAKCYINAQSWNICEKERNSETNTA